MNIDNALLYSLQTLTLDKKNQLVGFLLGLFKSDLILIKEIVLDNPPHKYTRVFKKPKVNRKGETILKQDYYLTGNLFYADKSSFHLISKIIDESKDYLHPYLKGLPELEKMRLEFEYHKMQDIDLDNKASYWVKLMLDILKTPTQKQIARATRYKKKIVTTNTIKDDNTKCISGINLKFVKGEHKMIFKIYGKVKDEQKKMDLFFVN